VSVTTVTTSTASVALPAGAKCICAGGADDGTASYGYTCALLVNGSVMCWGANSVGQLGQGDTTQRGDSTAAGHTMASLAVIDVGGGSPLAAAVTCGSFHVCVLTTTAGVRCWGYNGYGQVRSERVSAKGV
jgi:alpha-tubulin suppressor-like RCC1 family protein